MYVVILLQWTSALSLRCSDLAANYIMLKVGHSLPSTNAHNTSVQFVSTILLQLRDLYFWPMNLVLLAQELMIYGKNLIDVQYS